MSARGVGWRHRESQQQRFQQLFHYVSSTTRHILDMGCGVGDFYDFLRQNGYQGSYLGIDCHPQMIQYASEAYPSASFDCQNMMDDSLLLSADTVIASGVMNLVQEDPYHYLTMMVERLCQYASQQVIFNVLCHPKEVQRDSFFYYDPSKVVAICKSFGHSVVWTNEYLAHDMTVLIQCDC